MRRILFLILMGLATVALAQQSDSQLAYTYYQNKEYVKAAELFLQLYERNHASYYLDYHIICLINAKEYDAAEKSLKKFLKADDNNKDFLVDLGYIYTQQGKVKKAEEYYNRAIKKLIPHESDIRNLASRFTNVREYGYANTTYLRGRELLKRPTAFTLEMGDNYMMERDYDNMFTLFVETLTQSPEKLGTVTSKLGFARTYDVDRNADKTIAPRLKMILSQKEYPPVFDELGVWYSLQTGQCGEALERAIRLNAKQTGKLQTFIQVAHESASAGKYDVAERACQQIIQRGKDNNPYYYTARKEILTNRHEQLNRKDSPSNDYALLVGECDAFLHEFGYNSSDADIITLESDVYAYRLLLPDSANTVLQRGINIRRLDNRTLYAFKSKRADLLTFMGNPWEAVILYTQAEKANPNDDVGFDAKLKKARLAYFQGDLMWAKAQYDALKGSTTKLISNDAIQMSHFLNSNYDEEGDNADLQRVAQAEYAVYRHAYDKAIPTLDSLIKDAEPGIADHASMVKAKLLQTLHKGNESTPIWERLSRDSEQTYIRAEALFELGKIEKTTGDRDKALTLFQKLVSDYSGSVYSVEAGKLYRELEKL